MCPAGKKTDQPKASDPESLPNKGRNMFVSALVAGLAMLGYAFAVGLVQVFTQLYL